MKFYMFDFTLFNFSVNTDKEVFISVCAWDTADYSGSLFCAHNIGGGWWFDILFYNAIRQYFFHRS